MPGLAQEIEAARGRLQFADSELTLAKQNYERSTQLADGIAISRAEFDTISERLAATKALLLVRKQELDLLESGTREEEIREAKSRMDEAEQAWILEKNGYRKEEIDKAKAARDAAQASLDVIREQKKELSITCPIDGVIEALDLQPGDLVPSGAPVLSVMDVSHLWVRATSRKIESGCRSVKNWRSPSIVFPIKLSKAKSSLFRARPSSHRATCRRRKSDPNRSSVSKSTLSKD